MQPLKPVNLRVCKSDRLSFLLYLFGEDFLLVET